MAIASASHWVCLTKSAACVEVGQQLLAGHRAFGAVAVFLVALHGFQRTEHAQFRFHRDADRVRELDHLARHFDVVFVLATDLAVVLRASRPSSPR